MDKCMHGKIASFCPLSSYQRFSSRRRSVVKIDSVIYVEDSIHDLPNWKPIRPPIRHLAAAVHLHIARTTHLLQVPVVGPLLGCTLHNPFCLQASRILVLPLPIVVPVSNCDSQLCLVCISQPSKEFFVCQYDCIHSPSTMQCHAGIINRSCDSNESHFDQ